MNLTCQLHGHDPIQLITAATLDSINPLTTGDGPLAGWNLRLRADGRIYYCSRCRTQLRGPLQHYAREGTWRGRLNDLTDRIQPVRLLEPIADRVNRRWWLFEHDSDRRLIQAWADLAIDQWALAVVVDLAAGHGGNGRISLAVGPLTVTLKL